MSLPYQPVVGWIHDGPIIPVSIPAKVQPKSKTNQKSKNPPKTNAPSGSGFPNENFSTMLYTSSWG